MTSRPRRVTSSETAPCLPSTVHWRNSHSPTTQIASSKTRKERTEPNQGRKPHTHKGEYTQADYIAVRLLSVHLRGDVFSRLSLKYSCFRID